MLRVLLNRQERFKKLQGDWDGKEANILHISSVFTALWISGSARYA